MKKQRFIAGVCAAAIATGAAAQEPASEGRTADQIVVTAQKREQSILDVGLTVNAISKETLRDSRVLEMREIATFVRDALLDLEGLVPGLREELVRVFPLVAG